VTIYVTNTQARLYDVMLTIKYLIFFAD